MATTWNYDQALDTVEVTVDSVNGDGYHASCPQSGAFDDETAAGSTLTLTVDLSASGFSPGEGFSINVRHNDGALSPMVAGNNFTYGTSSTTGTSKDVTWTWDGTSLGTAQFTAPNSDNWRLSATYSHSNGSPAGQLGSNVAGPGLITCSVTLSATIGSAQLFVELIDDDSANGDSIASRLFTPGVSGTGTAGNPSGGGGGGGTLDDPEGVCIAFSDHTLAVSPGWTRVDL